VTTDNTHNRQISISMPGFEPEIPGRDRPQTEIYTAQPLESASTVTKRMKFAARRITVTVIVLKKASKF
jgi:hypothetical protein